MKKFSIHWKKYLNTDNVLLLSIVITGALLRFYNYKELPFTFDEFSAFFRTRFDNFQDLIFYGVKTTDTHPAGVQVFMYYWIKLFGESEPVVKLPFTIFGILAIIVAYKIAGKWFNNTVGLFVALFIAVLQYPITYSQIARPYISGMFFSLLMVWFWTNVVFGSGKKYYLNLTGYIICSAICAYNHHFSLMLVALVGFSGLIYVKKEKLKSYILSGVVIFLLYIPHLPIFAVQLQHGGVEEWLGKPEPDFFLNYIEYILHFSNLMFVISCLLIVVGFIYFSKNFKETNKFRILSFSWFSISFLTGYFYSVYVNAVLQYSVLIFTYPFLVMFVFSFYRDIKSLYKIVIIIVFTSVSIFTLIYEREHYKLFYESGYKEILIESAKVNKVKGEDNVTTILYLPEKIHEYYLDKLQIDGDDFYNPANIGNFIKFREFLTKQSSDYLVIGWGGFPNLEYLAIAEEIYPYMIQKKTWFNTDFYLFSKIKPKKKDYSFADRIIYHSEHNFDKHGAGWDDVKPINTQPGISYKDDRVLRLDKTSEYSPGFRAELHNIIEKKTNIIFISVDALMPDTISNALLVSVLKSEGKVIDWRANSFNDFIDKPNKRLSIYLAVKLPDINLDYPDIEISTFVWNKNLEEFFVDDFRIVVREGNPVIYSLYYDF
ncbi:MAG: glycosyltransferase family 39 protein [Bacteroidales bacterium]|nr:glycosyltransferase family 39 protein [Bacteroidales bacterium]